MGGESADRLKVIAALRRLGFDPEEDEVPVARLAGGLSGASVWGVDVDGRALVLKMTSPGCEATERARAEREFRFYRDLAGLVPLRVPRLIAQVSGPGEGTALLLEACPPAPPLDGWSQADFERVARDLGLLHGTFRGTAHPVLPRWLEVSPPVSPGAAAEASVRWAGLEVADDLLPLRRAAERMVLAVPRLDRERERLPLTLCHGDAHRDNLLWGDADSWVWADWQEVRLGEGVDDLAFFWQRAYTVTESLPPVERLLGAYAEGLSRAGGSGVSEDGLARALAWSELVSWLVAWPPYLGWLGGEVRDRVLRRIDVLRHGLGLDTG